MEPNLYSLFLCLKGLLNLGASVIAFYVIHDAKMAGFWLLLGMADLWIGWMSR